MGIVYEGENTTLSGVIYEDEVLDLRQYLQEQSPKKLKIDFSECDDIHFAVMQLLLAYKKNYDIDYIFGTEKKLFQKVLEGFDKSENHCS